MQGLFKKIAVVLGLSVVFMGSAYATDTISGVATTLQGNFNALAKLVTAGAYLAGLGFAVGSILKFKQHKDNPTQITVGTPVAMLFVAIALLFLPSVLNVASKSIFGDTRSGSISGTDDITGG